LLIVPPIAVSVDFRLSQPRADRLVSLLGIDSSWLRSSTAGRIYLPDELSTCAPPRHTSAAAFISAQPHVAVAAISRGLNPLPCPGKPDRFVWHLQPETQIGAAARVMLSYFYELIMAALHCRSGSLFCYSQRKFLF
jgi:hypothetical protein